MDSNNGESYSLVPYTEKTCQTVDANLGVTFLGPTTGYSLTPVLTPGGDTNGCAVITKQGSYSFKFEWYLQDSCIKKPTTKPYYVEVFQSGVCKYSDFLADFYQLVPTSQVEFPEDALKVQVTTKSSSGSGCDTIIDGYFNFYYNGTSFTETRSFVTYTQNYFCDQDLNPFVQECDSFYPNCTNVPLKNDCVQDYNFIYTCFGSSSSSISSSSN